MDLSTCPLCVRKISARSDTVWASCGPESGRELGGISAPRPLGRANRASGRGKRVGGGGAQGPLCMLCGWGRVWRQSDPRSWRYTAAWGAWCVLGRSRSVGAAGPDDRLGVLPHAIRDVHPSHVQSLGEIATDLSTQGEIVDFTGAVTAWFQSSVIGRWVQCTDLTRGSGARPPANFFLPG